MNHFYYGLDLSDFSSIEDTTLKTLQYSDISLGPSFSYIPKLTYPNIHYRCPKCYNFPLIQFLDRENINYKCACIDKKRMKIKELFKKEANFLTFLNEPKSNNNEKDETEKKNEKIGFKYTSHHSTKENKFRYYCITCNENLCKECIQNHISKEKDHYFLHDLIILDFQNV